MAKVKLRLRGGPYDDLTVAIDGDPDNPPELYRVGIHGPHETLEQCEYRRAGREQGQTDAGRWTYEAAGCGPARS
jgi:hypothetical protein